MSHWEHINETTVRCGHSDYQQVSCVGGSWLDATLKHDDVFYVLFINIFVGLFSSCFTLAKENVYNGSQNSEDEFKLK